MPDLTPKSPETDPTLYLYTSLTAGSSHIITATSRLETILKANKIPFRAIDVATDDHARKLWGRRSRGRKLPGLVKFGGIVGDMDQIEEWNEYGELKMQIRAVKADFDLTPITSATTTPSRPTATTTPAPSTPRIQIQDPPPSRETAVEDRMTLTLRQAGEEAASKAKENTKAKLGTKTSGTPQPEVKEGTESSEATKKPEEEKIEKEEKTEGKLETTDAKEPAEEAEKKIEKQEEKTEDKSETTDAKTPAEEAEHASETLKHAQRRASLAHGPDVSETAIKSSADLAVKSQEASDLSEHHRSSEVSATSPKEIEQVAQELKGAGESAAGDEKKKQEGEEEEVAGEGKAPEGKSEDADKTPSG
ncbi:hypothetical protein AJ80_08690 [Polytolypa hystricis UAMH7299]|uniref:Uncharacterized protein n=1 Tax=Polytolypa hystricis (strain UAMH7299) TaxID=1447883 RepID=A0A2B7X3X6_POLH7|nr:hypothetical protein AJ80_08690 [Polytolypa hystricis UAMH7299]